MSTGAQDNLSGGTFEVIIQDPTTPSQLLGITATGEAKVSVTQPLPAGTALIGKVGIDQTTPGTTNAVQANAGTNLNTSALALSATQTNGNQKTQVVDASGNVQPSGDVLTRKIFFQPTDGSNNQGYTASSEAKVLVTPLTNSSVVKAQLQDNAGTAITLGQKAMTSSVPVVLSSDQTGINTFLDKSGSGTIVATNGAVTATTNGASTVVFNITGTWVGTVVFEGQDGNANWLSTIGTVPGNGSPTAASGVNIALSIPSGGFNQVRARASVYVSGTITVTYNVGAGINTLQIFNLTPSALQTTARLNDGAGVSILSGYGSAANALRVAAEIGNGTAVADFSSGATSAQTLRTASNLYDGSGTAVTTTAIAGAAVSKQPVDTSIVAPAILYYSAPVEVHQTAATATAATIWAMRNAAASTRTVYVERIQLSVDFSGTNPVTRSLLGYDLCRFSTATPTAGAAITVIKMDNSGNPSTQVTDVRDLDTGLTTTSVVFETAFATVAVGSTDGATREYTREGISLKLAAGEGLCIRLTNTAIIGLNISGEIVWSER